MSNPLINRGLLSHLPPNKKGFGGGVVKVGG